MWNIFKMKSIYGKLLETRVIQDLMYACPNFKLRLRDPDMAHIHRRSQCRMSEYARDLERAQNSNHFCHDFNFSSNFEPSQNFRTKKRSQLRVLTCDQCFEQKFKRNWTVRILSNLKFPSIFRYVLWAPSMDFWAIPGYLRVCCKSGYAVSFHCISKRHSNLKNTFW